MPERIQRSRRRGWRMPAGAIYVGRPTKWGNIYRSGPGRPSPSMPVPAMTTEEATSLFRRTMDILIAQRPQLLDEIRAELGGRDLVCWCRPGTPCHADVLLQLANPPTCEAVP